MGDPKTFDDAIRAGLAGFVYDVEMGRWVLDNPGEGWVVEMGTRSMPKIRNVTDDYPVLKLGDSEIGEISANFPPLLGRRRHREVPEDRSA